MPETLPHVLEGLSFLQSCGIDAVTLLVVPGCEWSAGQLDTLRELADRGYVLAGHGWRHDCTHRMDLYHRVHSAAISSNVAEHLSRNADEIAQLIQDNFAWFEAHGFAAPDFYVPPAWAMGAISRRRLQALPYRRYETLGGVYDAEQDRFVALPLVGYEADRASRVPVLKAINGVNRGWARLSGRPLRVSIHPYDFEYALGDDLRGLLRRGLEWMHYAAV